MTRFSGFAGSCGRWIKMQRSQAIEDEKVQNGTTSRVFIVGVEKCETNLVQLIIDTGVA